MKLKNKCRTRCLLPTVLSMIMLTMIGLSCSKMNDTYKDFLSDGERIYVGKADSVNVYPGKNRLLLSWLAISDPKIKSAKIYWNNRTDSLAVAIHKSPKIDTVNVLIDDLSENAYSFDIIIFDDEGNRSIVVNATGSVYGDQYQQSLLTRPYSSVEWQDDVLAIAWGAASTGAIGSEIEYAAKNGAQKKLYMPVDADTTKISDLGEHAELRYRTLFMPDSLAIDTFYTDYHKILY